MPAIVRLGDTGTHGGAVATAAPNWHCMGPRIARIGDIYACPIHGPNPIVEGSPTTQCEGEPIARHGDKTACGASLIAGQSAWFCD